MNDRFTVFPNHATLHCLLTIDDCSGRILRWRLSVAEFYFEVTYKKNKINMQADALSRPNTTIESILHDDRQRLNKGIRTGTRQSWALAQPNSKCIRLHWRPKCWSGQNLCVHGRPGPIAHQIQTYRNGRTTPISSTRPILRRDPPQYWGGEVGIWNQRWMTACTVWREGRTNRCTEVVEVPDTSHQPSLTFSQSPGWWQTIS